MNKKKSMMKIILCSGLLATGTFYSVDSASQVHTYKLVNMEALYNALPRAKRAQKQFHDEYIQMQESMKAKMEKYTTLLKALQSAENIDPERQKAQEEKLSRLAEEIKLDQSQAQSRLNARREKLLGAIDKEIENAAAQLAKKHNKDDIFGYQKGGPIVVLYTSGASDFTNTMIKKLQRK